MDSKPDYRLLVSILRDIQHRTGLLEEAARDIRGSVLSLREEVNNLRSDVLRQEGWQARVDLRLDRIDRTLGIESGLDA